MSASGGGPKGATTLPQFLTRWTFRIFLFFLLRGGEGGVQSTGGGGGAIFSGKSQEGSPRWWGRGSEGAESVCGEFGGGLNIFFRGRNSHQVKTCNPVVGTPFVKHHLNKR